MMEASYRPHDLEPIEKASRDEIAALQVEPQSIPEGFEVTVRNLVLAAGAGFVVPLLGDMIRMPGLPATPQAVKMDLVDGQVVGMLG